ncbi:hypothetical protein [Paracoccus sp. (in: a-proteobacteria)]|uniref:hypothetical protein n=1 Tax=Paracoccus sp. TaxID=267 RepID=UPI002AFF04B2|nr:hypothetical protein [Paracoccus sp. (in: a-proteobacteria)]
MARGFATGLVHGALICGAALVGLSLVLPQPSRPQGPALDEAPVAETLTVPAGSEFSRASDMQPQPPAPLSAEGPRSAATPQVQRPADEFAPVAAEPAGLRPQTPDESPASPEMALPETDSIDLPELVSEAPIPVPPPGKVVVPRLDRAPEQALSAPAAATPETVTAHEEPADADPAEVAVPQAEPPLAEAAGDPPAAPVVFGRSSDALAPPAADAPATIPTPEITGNTSSEGPVGLSRPAPDTGVDLSTPPDFGALRLTD